MQPFFKVSDDVGRRSFDHKGRETSIVLFARL